MAKQEEEGHNPAENTAAEGQPGGTFEPAAAEAARRDASEPALHREGAGKDHASGRDSDGDSVMRQVGAMASLGFEFIAAVLLPTGLGFWLDRCLHTLPAFLLVGGVIGFIIGLRRLISSARAASK